MRPYRHLPAAARQGANAQAPEPPAPNARRKLCTAPGIDGMVHNGHEVAALARPLGHTVDPSATLKKG